MRWHLGPAVLALLALGQACGARPQPAKHGEPSPPAPPVPAGLEDDGRYEGMLHELPFDAALEREIARLTQAVAAAPSSALAHRELALVLRRAERRQQALEEFKTAHALDPQDERLRLELALAYSTVARLAEAEELYRSLVDSPALRPVALHNLGNIAMRRERLDEAIEFYRKAIASQPDYLLAHYHMGLALQEQGKTDEAYEAFNSVMRLDAARDRTKEAARFDALHRMATLDLAAGRAKRAAELLAQLLRYYPDHPNANYTYGRALLLLGREAEARAAFARHLAVPRRIEGRTGFIGPGDEPPRAPDARFDFRDATATSGIHYVNLCGATPTSEKGWSTELLGAGLGWLDYDGDGHLDLYLANGSSYERGPEGGEPDQLFRGDGRGGFRDVTAEAGLGDRRWSYGVAVGDIDNDGDPDLYLTNYGPNVLYRNNGDGTFTDITARAGVGHDAWGASAAFFDIEPDGDLDLYVANYMVCGPGKVPRRGETPYCAWKGIDVACGPKGLVPFHDVLYRNNGDGTFTDVTRASGVGLDEGRYGLGVVTADLDNDGRQDIYVANDSRPNSLWHNNGDGTFTDSGVATMSAFDADGNAQSGMGADAGDIDGDGWLDLVVTNFSHDLNTVYRSVGGKYFLDESSTVGLAPSYMALSWGVGFHDFDRDGDLDLFIANGHFSPEVDDYDVGTHFRQFNHLYAGDGHGHFVESSREAGPGFATLRSFRGAAFADYDNDGDVDVAVTALDEPLLLLENQSPSIGHWLAVRLQGSRSNRDGVGARVTVVTAQGTQIRERLGGGSYLSASDGRLHFGLGQVDRIERLEVRWPSGTRDVLRDVAVDRLLSIVEGSSGPG